MVQGGDFLQAFASGGFSSLGAAAFGLMGGSFASSAVGTVVFGAISGGIGSALTGGNFWQGVVIGGIVAGLNHALHLEDTKPSDTNEDDGGCLTCPNPRKINDGEIRKSFWDGTPYLNVEGTWVEVPAGKFFKYNDKTYFVPRVIGGLGSADFITGKGSFKILSAYKSALALAKGGLTNVGRAIQKHPNIFELIGVEASKVTTNALRNQYGAQALKYLIRNGSLEIRTHKSFGVIAEYK